MTSDLWGNGAGQLHEVSIDQPHHVEAIRHNPGSWKIAPDQGSVRAAQIDTDDFNSFATFELAHIGFQLLGTAPGHHVKDPVVFEIAKGRREAMGLVHGVLVETEHQGALLADALACLALGELGLAARHGGRRGLGSRG